MPTVLSKYYCVIWRQWSGECVWQARQASNVDCHPKQIQTPSLRNTHSLCSMIWSGTNSICRPTDQPALLCQHRRKTLMWHIPAHFVVCVMNHFSHSMRIPSEISCTCGRCVYCDDVRLPCTTTMGTGNSERNAESWPAIYVNCIFSTHSTLGPSVFLRLLQCAHEWAAQQTQACKCNRQIEMFIVVISTYILTVCAASFRTLANGDAQHSRTTAAQRRYRFFTVGSR